MAKSKKPARKKAKKKKAKGSKDNPRSDSESAGTPAGTIDPPGPAEPPPTDDPAFEPPPESFEDDIPEVVTGAPVFSIAELIQELPDEQLRQLIASDRMQYLINEEWDEGEATRKEVDRLFAMVEGLDPRKRHECTFQVSRVKPLYHKGVRTEGLCDNFHLPFSLSDVRERFGGGVYEITLFLPGENKGQQTSATERRTATVSIVGEPNVYSLERDNNPTKGVQLDPKVQGSIEEMREQLVELKAELKAQQTGSSEPSFMEKILSDAMPSILERIMNPPAPEPPPPPPAPPSMLEQFELMERLSAMITKMAPPAPLASDSSAGDSDDDSTLANFRRGLEQAKGSAELLKELMQTLGLDKSKEQGQTSALTDEEKKEHELKSAQLLIDLVDLCWDHLMDGSQTADTTATALHAFVQEKVPSMYQGYVKAYLTEDYVLNFLAQRSGGDEGRIRRLESKRGEAMVRSVVKKLNALLNGGS